ncbi:MAG: FtsX-like permease family protein [Halanaerobiales bacterium]|nr:FtsX-like permease family protein [Halanaerobiales bacterium]
MINSYQKITLKYLKANYRRTILTIIGIVLSISLISSIGFFMSGLQQAKIEEMKNKYGSFHLYFERPTADLISKIKNNPQVGRSGLYTRGQNIQLKEDLQLTPLITSAQAGELLPYQLSQGRLPDHPGEVALEEWVLRSLGQQLALGEQIILQDKEYQLVGLIEDKVQHQIKAQGILLTKNNQIKDDSSILLVEISPQTSLPTALAELKRLSPKDLVHENGHLLFMLGRGDVAATNRNMYAVIYVIIAIVVIATIAVIYNSFQISVVERIRQFGLLRTIGSTPKQTRQLVFREATFLAIIALPLGLMLGIAAIYGVNLVFTLLVQNSALYFRTALSGQVVLISTGLGLLSIYGSAFLPAWYASRLSPLVAISSRALISTEKIKRRKSQFFRKLFGFAGELAVKNIKRNTKRYRITVFSMVISVVLFITFSSFIEMSLVVSDNLNESQQIHFSVIGRNTNSPKPFKFDDALIKQLQSIANVQQVFRVYQPADFSVLLARGSEIGQIRDINGIYHHLTRDGQKKTLIKGALAIYDPPALQVARKYLQAGKINPQQLNQENGVIIINKNRIDNRATRKTYFGPLVSVKVDDEIELSLDNSSADQLQLVGPAHPVQIAAIVSDDPFYFPGGQNKLKMITTEAVARRLLAVDSLTPVSLNIRLVDPQKEEETKATIAGIIGGNSSLRLINRIAQNRQARSAILLVKILLYGFVLVVSGIGVVNIVNTITTNILIRKREFAMLKSIGLTPKGLKKMVVVEGLLYGIKASIYGSLLGAGLSYLLYLGLSNVRALLWQIPWSYMAIATIASLVIGYLSVLLPLARVEKENLLELVREDF